LSDDREGFSDRDDDEADETEDCESSKLSCVVGVDRDEVGESALRNLCIRLRSRVRSLNILSLTKEEKELLRFRKVVGVRDIKVVAGADGPDDEDVSGGRIAAEARLRMGF